MLCTSLSQRHLTTVLHWLWHHPQVKHSELPTGDVTLTSLGPITYCKLSIDDKRSEILSHCFLRNFDLFGSAYVFWDVHWTQEAGKSFQPTLSSCLTAHRPILQEGLERFPSILTVKGRKGKEKHKFNSAAPNNCQQILHQYLNSKEWSQLYVHVWPSKGRSAFSTNRIS